MTTDLVKQDAPAISISDIQVMGAAMAKSGLFGIKTADQAIALMIVAQAQGRHPASVAMEYDIIQGRPALKSQSALMRFQQSGGVIQYLTRSDVECKAAFKHPQGGELVVTWTMERAKQMGLADKDNWKKQPMIMLQWRTVAEGVRAVYPACLGGSYLVEEVIDFDPPKKEARDITPPEPEAPTQQTTPQAAPQSAPPAPKPQAQPDGKLTATGYVSNITPLACKKAKPTDPDKFRYKIELTDVPEPFYTFDKKIKAYLDKYASAGTITIEYVINEKYRNCQDIKSVSSADVNADFAAFCKEAGNA